MTFFRRAALTSAARRGIIWSRQGRGHGRRGNTMRKRPPLDETQRSFTQDQAIIVPLTVKDAQRPEIARGNR